MPRPDGGGRRGPIGEQRVDARVGLPRQGVGVTWVGGIEPRARRHRQFFERSTGADGVTRQTGAGGQRSVARCHHVGRVARHERVPDQQVLETRRRHVVQRQGRRAGLERHATREPVDERSERGAVDPELLGHQPVGHFAAAGVGLPVEGRDVQEVARLIDDRDERVVVLAAVVHERDPLDRRAQASMTRLRVDRRERAHELAELRAGHAARHRQIHGQRVAKEAAQHQTHRGAVARLLERGFRALSSLSLEQQGGGRPQVLLEHRVVAAVVADEPVDEGAQVPGLLGGHHQQRRPHGRTVEAAACPAGVAQQGRIRVERRHLSRLLVGKQEAAHPAVEAARELPGRDGRRGGRRIQRECPPRGFDASERGAIAGREGLRRQAGVGLGKAQVLEGAERESRRRGDDLRRGEGRPAVHRAARLHEEPERRVRITRHAASHVGQYGAAEPRVRERGDARHDAVRRLIAQHPHVVERSKEPGLDDLEEAPVDGIRQRDAERAFERVDRAVEVEAHTQRLEDEPDQCRDAGERLAFFRRDRAIAREGGPQRGVDVWQRVVPSCWPQLGERPPGVAAALDDRPELRLHDGERSVGLEAIGELARRRQPERARQQGAFDGFDAAGVDALEQARHEVGQRLAASLHVHARLECEQQRGEARQRGAAGRGFGLVSCHALTFKEPPLVAGNERRRQLALQRRVGRQIAGCGVAAGRQYPFGPGAGRQRLRDIAGDRWRRRLRRGR
ncbi:MAG: hypothetical protein U0P30_04225 [Vicinamibacterales bacterium]